MKLYCVKFFKNVFSTNCDIHVVQGGETILLSKQYQFFYMIHDMTGVDLVT